jgi:hypothetical protein
MPGRLVLAGLSDACGLAPSGLMSAATAQCARRSIPQLSITAYVLFAPRDARGAGARGSRARPHTRRWWRWSSPSSQLGGFVARERLAFTLRDLEHQFVEAGVYAAERLPERAAVVTVKYSGSVYYYASRPTCCGTCSIRRGSIQRSRICASGATCRLVLATDEEPVFRKRFGSASVLGGLDWPPIARVGRTVRVYDPADHARYFAGEIVRTEDVWSTPPRRRRR